MWTQTSEQVEGLCKEMMGKPQSTCDARFFSTLGSMSTGETPGAAYICRDIGSICLHAGRTCRLIDYKDGQAPEFAL